MLKIVHVIYSFGIGGLEKGISTLINHGSAGIEHSIISLCGNRESEKSLIKHTQIYCLDKQQGNSVGFIWKLSRLIRNISPDIVHTRNWSGMDGIFAAKLAGVKIIIHGEHGWDMFDPFGASLKRRAIRRFSSIMVDQYICVSKQLKSWLLNDVKVGKGITQIYNGVDTEQFRPPESDGKKRIRKDLGFSDEHFIIGIIGRLDSIKNHSNLFKAFKIVVQKNPLAILMVVGDGAERERLEKESGKNIVFLGYRSDTDNLMRFFDLFVLPSLNEGISNTILEAMATGLPVIASNVGGNPELVEDGDNGFLVDPLDPARMADKIIDCINSPDMIARLGVRGRKLAVEKFSIESMVGKYEEVYQTSLRA